MALLEESYVVLNGTNAFVDYTIEDSNSASFRIDRLGGVNTTVFYYYSNDRINWVPGLTTAIVNASTSNNSLVQSVGVMRAVGHTTRTSMKYFRILIVSYGSDIGITFISARTGA